MLAPAGEAAKDVLPGQVAASRKPEQVLTADAGGSVCPVAAHSVVGDTAGAEFGSGIPPGYPGRGTPVSNCHLRPDLG